MARQNAKITITPGTPIRIATALGLNLTSGPIYVDRWIVQMGKGGTGLGYVLGEIPVGVTPDKANAAHVVVELAPASGTAPGGSYSDTMKPTDGGGLDITQYAIDGDAADPVRVSISRR